MTTPLAATRPQGELYRVGRAPDAWAWPPWESTPARTARSATATTTRAVNTACSTPAPNASARSSNPGPLPHRSRDPRRLRTHRVDPEDADAFPTIPPGVVPADWRLTRKIGKAGHPGPFPDIGHSTSLTHLRTALASRLLHYGLDDLDSGDVRRRVPRALTQELSRYVFENSDTADGEPLLGIQYLSRLGDDVENWAIFEGSDPQDPASDNIRPDDPDLASALATIDLVLATG